MKAYVLAICVGLCTVQYCAATSLSSFLGGSQNPEGSFNPLNVLGRLNPASNVLGGLLNNPAGADNSQNDQLRNDVLGNLQKTLQQYPELKEQLMSQIRNSDLTKNLLPNIEQGLQGITSIFGSQLAASEPVQTGNQELNNPLKQNQPTLPIGFGQPALPFGFGR